GAKREGIDLLPSLGQRPARARPIVDPPHPKGGGLSLGSGCYWLFGADPRRWRRCVGQARQRGILGPLKRFIVQAAPRAGGSISAPSTETVSYQDDIAQLLGSDHIHEISSKILKS